MPHSKTYIKQGTQCTYNVTEVHSCNHFCSGEAIKYYTSQMFVASGTQHAMCKHHTVICGLHSKTIFFHIIS